MLCSMRRMSTKSLPMPAIMRVPFAAGLLLLLRRLLQRLAQNDAVSDGQAHLSNRLLQAHEDRLADDEMPDIQLAHLRQGGKMRGGFVIEAVACVHLDARLFREPGGMGEPLEFGFSHGGISGEPCFAIGSGVELDN